MRDAGRRRGIARAARGEDMPDVRILFAHGDRSIVSDAMGRKEKGKIDVGGKYGIFLRFVFQEPFHPASSFARFKLRIRSAVFQELDVLVYPGNVRGHGSEVGQEPGCAKRGEGQRGGERERKYDREKAGT